ncbi:MAG: MerR family transcriptional regulator [Propioniciclava sp.]|uniref:MerR family transcriptional regulator n=1 Tax=Propioniciclava sp. TaxID=2038686 RepID=UPI0039E3BE91
MLTIRRLADYVGVTTRAIRHYHALGLLPEPTRAANGYRVYDAQAVVNLQRIKVLTDAGLPLGRVKDLLDADRATLLAAVAQAEDALDARIEQLQRTRRSLAALTAEEPFLPPGLAAMQRRMRVIGVSERTLSIDRGSWILIGVLYPELVAAWLASQVEMMDDDAYRELYLRVDRSIDWAPDDPRIEQLAQDLVAWSQVIGERMQPLDTSGWQDDTTAYSLVVTYRRARESLAWDALMNRVQELIETDIPR